MIQGIEEIFREKFFLFFYYSKNLSDDMGSDSSIDDGLPKHLEAVAAAKVIRTFFNNYIITRVVLLLKAQLNQARKKTAPIKLSKDTKRKDEMDKENFDKVASYILKFKCSTLPFRIKPLAYNFPNFVLLSFPIL